MKPLPQRKKTGVNEKYHAISRHRVITPLLTPPYHRWRELSRYSVSTENTIGKSRDGVKCPDITSFRHFTPAMVWWRDHATSRLTPSETNASRHVTSLRHTNDGVRMFAGYLKQIDWKSNFEEISRSEFQLE